MLASTAKLASDSAPTRLPVWPDRSTLWGASEEFRQDGAHAETFNSPKDARLKLFPPRVSLVFAAVVAATLGGAVLSSHVLDGRRADAAGVGNSWRSLAAVEHVISVLRKAEAACRDREASGSETARRRYAEAAGEVDTAMELLGTALAGRADGLAALAAVSSDLRVALAALERMQRAPARHPSPRSAGHEETRAAIERAETGLAGLQAQARRELAWHERRAAQSTSVSNFVVVSTDAAVLLLVAVAVFAVRGHLRERERREAERRQALELQQQLLGIVGHDLRTPLNAIAGSAAVLARAPDMPSNRLRAAQRILSSAGRMSRMIRDLLDYTRARVGGLPISPEPAHLGELGRRVVQEVLAARPGRTITFTEQGDLEGEWDPARLEQVFSNLVANACHHGAEGTPVLVRVTGTPGAVLVNVHNEGPPIPAEALPHIFEPFRRGVAESATTDGGLGLGLFIVRTLVEAHGGTIEVVTGGDGTAFQVVLPRRRPAGGGVRRASMA
jgi:signal transduction histidine kinase